MTAGSAGIGNRSVPLDYRTLSSPSRLTPLWSRALPAAGAGRPPDSSGARGSLRSHLPLTSTRPRSI